MGTGKGTSKSMRTRSSKLPFVGGRQRSGEGVVRRNGCPKGCFWRVRFFSAPSRFSGPFRCFKSQPTLWGQRRNAAPLARSDFSNLRFSFSPKLAGKPFQQGVSNSHSLLGLSDSDPPPPPHHVAPEIHSMWPSPIAPGRRQHCFINAGFR